MDIETFERKVRQGLKKLSREQQVNFAWRCAVRALPFLGSNGNFNFWKEEDRQKHIYAVFYALDVNAAAAVFTPANAVFTAANAVFTAANAAFTAAAAAAAFDTAFDAATAAAAAAAAAALFANAATTATVDAAAAASRLNIDLKNIILQDINTIQNKKGRSRKQKLTDLYGAIWDNFREALRAEGCEYWGKLYQNIFDNNFELDKIDLERRMSVPLEIREQGAAKVADYLEQLEKGAKRLNEARIIILGDKGAGKTCIARRLINPEAPMTTDEESTPGVDTTLWELEKENINVRIWDFAGHTVTHAVHQFFLSERCLYIIVYDGRTEDRNRLEYWLDHMKNYGGDSKAMILVNKRDKHSVDIPVNTLKEQYDIEGIYNFSIKKDKAKLRAFRQDVAAYIENNPSWEKQIIPTNYYQVKDELEQLFIKGEEENGTEHITKEKFVEIAAKYDVDNTDELLKDLHFLGVSLWYRDMEKYNTLILNPEWISHGVYKIVNWVNEEKRYDITLNDFAKVFKKDAHRYPENKYEFLFDLMKHYELAYETDRGKQLIIPHLLKEDRPDKLPGFPVGESLMLRYKAEQALPPHTISRFIVRHNQEIKKEKKDYLVWRYGVVLQDKKGSVALVREEDRTISVSVKGNDKTKYLSTLRDTLNDIFNTYKSRKPELQYRVERFGQIPEDVEAKDYLWLQDKEIYSYYKRNRPYYDVFTDQEIPMEKIVNNYNINGDAIIGGTSHKIIKHTFNFYDCNIGLQGSLNELAQLLKEGSKEEEAKELENTAKVLEQAEKYKTPEELKKKGITNKLQKLVDDLGNEGSRLHKTVKGIKNGISIAQDIAKGYNDIAQWAGLPQVPKPFLKKSGA